MKASPARARLARRWSLFTAASVFVLLAAGALVTSTGSGLAVPDWPLSYGQLMPPMVGGILYEHGHRMIAAAVSTLVGLQIAVLFFCAAPKAVQRLGLVAFAAILAQAILGGLTVLFLLPPAVSSAHAGLAEIVFALVSTVALLLSPALASGAFVKESGEAALERVDRARRATLVAAGAAYAQILLGAVMRHTGAGLAIPDFPLSFGRLVPAAASFAERGVAIHFAHRAGALAVVILVALAIRELLALRPVVPGAASVAVAWGALLALQILLGAASIWTKKSVPVTVGHLAVGALVWVTGVLLAVTLSRARALLSANAGTAPTRAASPHVSSPEGLPA